MLYIKPLPICKLKSSVRRKKIISPLDFSTSALPFQWPHFIHESSARKFLHVGHDSLSNFHL